MFALNAAISLKVDLGAVLMPIGNQNMKILCRIQSPG